MTHDTWHVAWVNILSKLQLFSSHSLGAMMFWRLWGKGSLPDWLTDLISDGGVCRTAPATPGLLITFWFTFDKGKCIISHKSAPIVQSLTAIYWYMISIHSPTRNNKPINLFKITPELLLRIIVFSLVPSLLLYIYTHWVEQCVNCR